jgi:soluble lytic murein transglycosylase-like protein
LGVLAALPCLAVAVASDAGAAGACEAAIARAERAAGIPAGLLESIGIVEAGRNGTIWPWTLNVAGEGRLFATAEAAVAAARRAPRRGNLDAGCLQVSLRHHDLSVPDALDPSTNAAYAARFLRGLRDRHGSWTEAVKNYHSGDPDRQRTYVCKVFRVYTGLAEGRSRDHPWCRTGHRETASAD